MFTRLSKVLMFTILGVVGPMAFGQGVGVGSPTDTNHFLQLLPPPYLEGVAIWQGGVGSLAVPVGVGLDPNGPAWTKHLQTQNGEPLASLATSIQFWEILLVTGDETWTGWHAELAPGFKWHTGGLGIFSPAPVVAIIDDLNNSLPVNYQLSESASKLDFTFPAVAPGAKVGFQFAFYRSEPTPFVGTFEMRQYPTPEPATLILIGAAGAFITRRRLARREQIRP